MKILAIVISLLIMQQSLGQDCRTTAENKSEPWRRMENIYATPQAKPRAGESAKLKSRLDQLESWIRTVLTGFTGAKVGYTNEYFLDYRDDENFFKATGIDGFYGSTTRFWAYYCAGNKIVTEGEAGSFIYVNFNNVFHSELTQDVGVHTINGKFAFRVLEKSHSEGRIDFYDRRKRMDYSDSIYTSKRDIIIIRNSDKPVFIPITRKEYLQQLLKDAEASRGKQKEMMTGIYNNSAKLFEEEMKVFKRDKNYTPEKEAKRRQWFAEDQAKREKLIQKIDPDVDAALEVIKQYLEKPAEWLSRTVGHFYSDSYTGRAFTKYFEGLDNVRESREDYTRSEVAYINPEYFNKALSRDVPQLIMVEFVKNGYRYMYKLSDKVKQSGTFASLAALVNPRNHGPTQTIAPVVTSTYTLEYLPKLTKLTPLVVAADMKPSAVPVVPNYVSATPSAKLNFEIPPTSLKLKELPQLLTAENYKTYIQQLSTSISNALAPEEKRKADEYLRNKKLTKSKDISNAALAAWLQNAPRVSLYFFSKVVSANPTDTLAANNLSAFLLMGGLPDKAVPILEYWNKQITGAPTILCNLGNAYFRLGDGDKTMKYLQQCVQRDTLNATANKILCLLYFKKGDTKKAQDHGTRSITTSHDEQVISVLRQLNKEVKPGEIMSRLHKKEFPLLKRAVLPQMPSSLDQMDQFNLDLEAEKLSVRLTIESLDAKMPEHTETVSRNMMNATVFAAGLSPVRVKAQRIIMDALQSYQKESSIESDAFKHYFKMLSAPHNAKVMSITKKYAAQLSKLEGGEAGDEDQIAALELAQCKEVNAEKEKYLAALAPLVNQYAQRQEYISRKFYRDYANWAPIWLPAETISFLSIQRDYLKDIYSILTQYKTVTKSKCTFEEETPPKKDGKLKNWEDDYCAIFKGKVGVGFLNVAWTCNSWGIEGGELGVGELEMKYGDDGSFEEFTVGAGFGGGLDVGENDLFGLEFGASVKEFIKIGPNKTTGKWEVRDWGVKAESAMEGSIGPVGTEIKILELSAAVNAGFEAGGVLAPVLNLK